MPRMLSVTLVAWLTGCTCSPDAAVHDAYEAARSEALAPPPPVEPDWAPDALLQVAPPLFDQLVAHALASQGSIRRDIRRMGVTVSPEVTVREASLTASPLCRTCVMADMRMDGTATWQSGLLGTGTVPIRVETAATIDLQAEQTDKGWEVRAAPQTAERVRVSMPGLPPMAFELFDEPLRQWVQEELEEMAPRVVGRLSKRYPIAAMRLIPAGDGLEVEIRTTATRPGLLQGSPPRPTEGWQVDVTTASAVALARTHLFERGPRTPLKVVGVPTSLGVLGNKLTADLRVWRPAGVGWWRDLRAEGTLAVDGDDVVLTPSGIEVTAVSEGAAWADPLSAAGEGLMVSELEKAMTRREHGVRSTELAGGTLTARTTGILGTEGGSVMRLSGALTID